MERDFDVIVVGGGHNGLTAAARLARSGARVTVFEARSKVGGMASTVEVLPGLTVDLGAEDAGLYRSDLIDELGLRGHGLEWVDAPAFACVPRAQGPPLVLWSDPRRATSELESTSKVDARRFEDFLVEVERLGGEYEGFLRRPPRLEDLGSLIRTPELVRFLTSSAAELATEWFESEAIRVLLASLAVTGTTQGPQSLGTGAQLLYQLAGTTALGLRPVRWIEGGTGKLSDALAGVVREHGGEVRCEAGVAEILVETTAGDGVRAVGVLLQSGEPFSSSIVLSNLDLRRTLFDLVGVDQLELRVTRRLRSAKYRGAMSRLIVEIDGDVPGLPGLDEEGASEALSGRVLVAENLDAIERAADDAKYGRWSSKPLLDVKAPCLGSGTSVLTINAQYSPFELRGSSWKEEREAWTEAILERLQGAFPGVRRRILRHRLLTPVDWRNEVGVSEGSSTHGEMILGQMLVMRPLPGLSGYETSIGRLLLCGAGAHPGGGVTGLPGAQAAARALELLS